MNIIQRIALLESNFTTSFKHTSSVLYDVTFQSSNVQETLQNLNQLYHNIKYNISTGKHVGYPIDLNDVEIVISLLNEIIEKYKELEGLSSIPSKLKLYEITDKLRKVEHQTTIKKQLNELHQFIIPAQKSKPVNLKSSISPTDIALKYHLKEVLKKKKSQ